MRQMPRLRDCAHELAAGVLRWLCGLSESRERRSRSLLIPRESWTASVCPTAPSAELADSADGGVDGLDGDRSPPASGTTTAGYVWYFDADVDGRDNGESDRRFDQF
jgi:hypothetical protein